MRLTNKPTPLAHKLSTMRPITPSRRKYRLRKDLRKSQEISFKGLADRRTLGYNDRMSNKTLNGANKSASNTRKGSRGPRPIQTVAQLRENLLRDALAREMRKIDRKIAVTTRKRTAAQARVTDANAALEQLQKIRAEFLRESSLAPKA